MRMVTALVDHRLLVRRRADHADQRVLVAAMDGPEAIVAGADTLDAMTSDRPYRKALPLEVALTEIRRCAGTQFDPALAPGSLSGRRYTGARFDLTFPAIAPATARARTRSTRSGGCSCWKNARPRAR